MTLKQAERMLKLRIFIYKAFYAINRVTGNYTNSNDAHDPMLYAYLKVRSLRGSK